MRTTRFMGRHFSRTANWWWSARLPPSGASWSALGAGGRIPGGRWHSAGRESLQRRRHQPARFVPRCAPAHDGGDRFLLGRAVTLNVMRQSTHKQNALVRIRGCHPGFASGNIPASMKNESSTNAPASRPPADQPLRPSRGGTFLCLPAQERTSSLRHQEAAAHPTG